MKKVLFTATVDSHILNFHLPYLKLFKDNGYEVHVATNGDEEIPYCDIKHKVSFERSPIKWNNIRAIKQLKNIINKEKFEIIHTHTPMGGVVTRLAAKSARKKLKTKVIYTAHGFHFYKEAPILNWLVYYPIERILSKYTDDIITINNEDYEFAKKKLKSTRIHYVPGVGMDSEKFSFNMTDEEKVNLRKDLGIEKEDFVLIYPAEISNRKRQIWLINTISHIFKKNKKMHLLLPGKDLLNGECEKLIKELELENQIHLLGFRKDIPKLIAISNLAVSSAKQEGLPVNVLESMYYGIPLIVTNCRGNRDLIKNEKNGYIVELNDKEDFCNKILKIFNMSKEELSKIKENNQKEIEKYVLDKVIKDMNKIYGLNIDK